MHAIPDSALTRDMKKIQIDNERSFNNYKNMLIIIVRVLDQYRKDMHAMHPLQLPKHDAFSRWFTYARKKSPLLMIILS